MLAGVQARPLILSMPIGGNFYDRAGISRSAREDYHAKLRALVQRYRFPLVEFKEHDEEKAFLSVRKVISQPKAGSTAIALLMISFMGARHERDSSNDV